MASLLGMFGLGSKASSLSAIHAAVGRGELDAPLFTTFLSHCDQLFCADGGQITFGATDRRHCEPVAEWVAVDEDTSFWRFAIGEVRLGKARLTSAASAAAGRRAVADIGTSLIVAPAEDVRRLADGVGARRTADGKYVVPCDLVFGMELRVGERWLLVPGKQLLLDYEPGSCRLALGVGEFDFWLLGTPFARSFCLVHDVAQRRLGFAPKVVPPRSS